MGHSLFIFFLLMRKIFFLLSLSIIINIVSSCSEGDDNNTAKNNTTTQTEDKPSTADTTSTEKKDTTSSSTIKVPSDTTGKMYQVAQMTINTEGGVAITGKTKEDYRNCNITITSSAEEWCYNGTGKIRGRGNSSWKWYDKKPYRIKLDEKSEILGLKANKDWVLLANYRDPTDLMNTFVFNMGEGLGMPYTNHTRYVEITLNGEYIGLYQLTEQIKVAKSRVNINKESGMLLELDADDGPELAPEETDNFWSQVYNLPVCVKYPKDPTETQLTSAKYALADIENAIKAHNYDKLCELMDVGSFIDYLLIQEFVYNVEMAAPRSFFLFRDADTKWTWGPLWDFDAGYDFDWSDMYTGHTFFTSYSETVLGTDPARHISDYTYTSSFFTDMWKNSTFVDEVRAHWEAMEPRIISEFWAETLKYYDGIEEALARDAAKWPIGRYYATEKKRMENWITNRVNFMHKVVANYPAQ